MNSVFSLLGNTSNNFYNELIFELELYVNIIKRDSLQLIILFIIY